MSDSEDNLWQSSGEVTNWFTTTCPYDKKTGYTYKLGTAKDADITLTATISAIAFSTFTLIIGAQIGINPKLLECLSGAYSYIKTRYPSTRSLSYKATNYAHKKYHKVRNNP